MIIIGLTKTGDIIFRCKFSKCEVCQYYIAGYKCKFEDYINVMCWNGFDSHKCDKFESTIKSLGGWVFRDYEDRNLFPEKIFGGRFKFYRQGNIIGEKI